MSRLTSDHLSALEKTGIRTPSYDRNQDVGVVHLGCGNFHRAHQAAFFDALMEAGEKNWMILAASLRSPDVAAKLNPQGGLYNLVERGGNEESVRTIGSLSRVLVAPENPEALIEAMARESVALVTLTVTEKGYRPALATGGLEMDDPDVRHDLENPETPRTAQGFLLAALSRRKTSGTGPLTILSCDNMPENGDAVRRGLMALADRQDPSLAAWIKETCTFPSSMVDRIVPATTESDIAALEARTGFRDEGTVATEAFVQWVIEDRFAGRRPPLGQVGVQFTNDVAAWEKAKLRLLNGAHSALAYLGYPAGHGFVHEVMAAPGFRVYLDRLWDEAEATLDPFEGFDPAAYRASLMTRFENPALEHRLFQIAMDGSQKIPQRFLATIRDRTEKGFESPALCLAVAAWMRWQFARTESGESFAVDDPLSGQTADIIEAANGDIPKAAAGLLSLNAVFSDEFRTGGGFSDAVSLFLEGLLARGSHDMISAFSG